MKTIKTAVLGYGYWGPNLVRNLNKLSGVSIESIVDLDEKKRKRVGEDFPSIQVSSNSDDIINNPNIDAIVVATPPSTHFDLAYKSLNSGKHVLIEKPIAQSSDDSMKLINLAKKNNLKLMVDHTFIYSGAVKQIKTILENNELGDLWYVDSVRINLGIVQKDVNVIWDLAPHDLSILEYIINAKPVSVSATGLSPNNYVGAPLEGIAYLAIKYDNGILAHLHLSWLAPVKMRRMMVGGSKKFLVYDHLDPEHQVKIYDKAIGKTPEGDYHILSERKEGDMYAPKIDQKEPLEEMVGHFIESISNNKTPISDGISGHNIVVTIEAAIRSMENGGAEINL